MKTLTMLVLSLLLAAAPAQGTNPPGEVLAADTPRTTHDGNSFIAPTGWSIRTAGAAVIVTAPEGDSHIALVDVSAKDADAAVAAAWAAYDPEARWPLAQASDRALRNGWDQERGYRYETPAGAGRAVFARALRHGARWTVLITDMSEAVAEKRDAQLELIHARLLPKGYQRETFAGKRAHALDATRLDALQGFVERARRQLDVPGVAIGLVQGGKVAFTGGFGVRRLGKPEKVDADTLFIVASNTKALTTLMLAKQVDAGMFTWETPVTQVLPSFKLGDAATTAQVKMKHLVCACTGLPRQDMEWIFEGERLTPDTVMATLGRMQPTSKFGELYQYSNLMAGAAGFAGGHALHPQRELGAAYDAAMQTLVFDPLGMSSTTFDFARAQRGNHAAPHGQDVDGRTVPSSMDLNYAVIPTRPDGGAWSNVNDMLRYVQMELDEGRLPDGTRYIGSGPLLARWEQQVARGAEQGYGMGLKIDRSFGTPMMHHGGIAFGYVSDMLWLPEHDVGAVILTNAEGGSISLRNLFRRRLFELLFDGKPEAERNAALFAKQMQETFAANRKRLSVPAEPAAAAKLAARYRNAELGNIEVTRRNGITSFGFGGWNSDVASRRDEDGTLTFVTISPSENGYEFVFDDKQGRRSLVLRDAQHEYVFVEAK